MIQPDVATDNSTALEPSRLRRPGGPIGVLLNLFSSIWLGVTLLCLLFTYCAVGSSGVPTGFNILDPSAWGEAGKVRQWRMIELTEFEWFHWWPFNLLIALICTNLVVATLRRIPFNRVNLGVWMIHAGIITLCLGSVWYFGTKVEGDAPVNRRRVVARLPDGQTASMVAAPGNRAVVGQGEDAYLLTISSIDPQWEMLSGDAQGQRAYSVNVSVQSKTGQFIRQLIAGYPQHTEDIIPSGNPQQPMSRALKVLGKPLVDEVLQLSLDYDPQEHFYLMDSHALYLREVGQTEWVQRPIENLPRYNDYIAAPEDVWLAPGETLEPDPIALDVPAAAPGDPLHDVPLKVSRYLRYAHLDSRRRPAPDGPLDPAVSITISAPQESQQFQLVALSEADNSALRGTVLFGWVSSAADVERLKSRPEAMLQFHFPDLNITIDQPIAELAAGSPDAPFTPLAGTDYSYRVENVFDNMDIGSVAIVRIKSPRGAFERWVFEDPARNSDKAIVEGAEQHAADLERDEKIQTAYRPTLQPPAPVMIIAGPGENDLAVVVTKSIGQPRFQSVKEGGEVELANRVKLRIDRYAARTINQTKPFVVPRHRRERDTRELLSMICVDVPLGESTQSFWLPYHLFAFANPLEVLRRFPYQPQTITLADGRQIEMMFSRARMPLPAPVALEDFQVDTHIGGFTPSTSSILDWKSIVRFDTGDEVWSESKMVAVNKPAEHEGFWFFQSQWDPPDQSRGQGDPGSRGLNYTVLGVGNRNGVHVQLAGCCIAVIGMIFNFYVKPIIKRRRQQAVYEETRGTKRPKHESRAAPEPVAAWRTEPS